jgi:hypothetical protein
MLPSGKRLPKNDGKTHFFYRTVDLFLWVIQLFLWQFSIAMLNYQRVVLMGKSSIDGGYSIATCDYRMVIRYR